MYVQLMTTIATITVVRPGLIRPGGAAVAERAGRGDPEREQQDRERERDVDQPRDDRVGDAAVVAGDHARARRRSTTDEGGRDERDLERDARAVEHAREDVLADRSRRRRGTSTTGPVGVPNGRVERAAGTARSADARTPSRSAARRARRATSKRDEPERDERDAVLPEPLPEELPRGAARDRVFLEEVAPAGRGRHELRDGRHARRKRAFPAPRSASCRRTIPASILRPPPRALRQPAGRPIRGWRLEGVRGTIDLGYLVEARAGM